MRLTPSARVLARSTASLAESTRLTWPMPTPTVALSLASKMALDFTARTARHANSSSAKSDSLRASPAARLQLAGLSPSAW